AAGAGRTRNDSQGVGEDARDGGTVRGRSATPRLLPMGPEFDHDRVAAELPGHALAVGCDGRAHPAVGARAVLRNHRASEGGEAVPFERDDPAAREVARLPEDVARGADLDRAAVLTDL